jgi:hypothetical protein
LGLGTTVHGPPLHDSVSVRPGFTPSEKLPTAWQNELPKQDTPLSSLSAPLAPDPLGLETMVQADPFHCSTSVAVELAPCVFPTATQNAGWLQETPCSSLLVDPAGAGLGTIVQDVPFHCSTRGTVADAVCTVPTATQSALLGHDTAKNWEAVADGGSGAVTVDHAAPSHCSMRIPSSTAPTAAQNEAPTQETPGRTAPPGTEGVATDVQNCPSYCSMKVPLVAPVTPVAIQKLELVQDTASKTLPVPCGGRTTTDASVQFVALTVGGTVIAAAETGGDPDTARAPQSTHVTRTAKAAVRRMLTPSTTVRPHP